MFVYLITNTINGKQYVGQTTTTPERRWLQHIRESRRKSGVLQSAICKYGKDAFFVATLATARSQEELNQKEQDFIFAYNTLNRDFGYNRHEGGNKPPLATPESIFKMVKANTGRKRSGVALENLRAGTQKRIAAGRNGWGTIGHFVSAETRAKIGAKSLGRKHSAQSLEKMSKNRARKIDEMTEKILHLHDAGKSARQIGRALNIHHASVLRRVKSRLNIVKSQENQYR
jgi:group I intron endonuclease